MTDFTFGLIGNPNCGKSTLFNLLTGARQHVGNWAGVTVEMTSGEMRLDGQTAVAVDLPGIYSLTPSELSGEDERVARDWILSHPGTPIVNIVDASNLERNLSLTAELLETGVPMLVVVNMLDVAKTNGILVNLSALEARLGCPVVGMVASRDKGTEDFLRALKDLRDKPAASKPVCRYDAAVEKALDALGMLFASEGLSAPRARAMQVLEGAAEAAGALSADGAARLTAVTDKLAADTDGNADLLIAQSRFAFTAETAAAVLTHKTAPGATLTDRIDRVVLNRWLGIPIFLAVMYLMFLFTQNLGAAFIDFFDILVGGIFVDGTRALLETTGAPEWLIVILADAVGGGIQTVSTFIPVVFFLFFFLAILEDSGYMARAAFVIDRLMRAIGLPGKAFVPLIVGFGCNVPAIMATRTMDRASDRITTVMMAPFMSCGARLPVYVLFATAFFPTNGQNLVFGLYLAGILAAVITGFLLRRIALPGSTSGFVMEIPPYHLPTVRGVMLRTYDRLKSFVFRAGRVIVVIVACLSILNSVGTDGSFGNEDSDNSVLSAVGRTIVPVLDPMGISDENWPAAVGIFTGVLAKEAVVGTMNSLYETMSKDAGGAEAEAEENEGWSLASIAAEAAGSVRDNLADLGNALLDPMGIQVGDLSDTEAALEEQEVSAGALEVMRRLFDGQAGAFAYLLMVLLYMPCGAAVAAVRREAGFAWTLFLCGWTTALGYCAATVFYRVMRFGDDPVYALCAFAGCAALMGAMLLWMKSFAKKNAGKGPKIIPIQAVSRGKSGGSCGCH